MSFQDELKSKIKSEEELKKKDIEKAIQTVYPDTSKFSCEASEYIKIKGEMKELDVVERRRCNHRRDCTQTVWERTR